MLGNETVLMGFFGMGSEPDFNIVRFEGLPMKRMNGQRDLNSFALLPGVTALRRFDAREVLLDPVMLKNDVLIQAGVSDFANRGMQATLQVIAPPADKL